MAPPPEVADAYANLSLPGGHLPCIWQCVSRGKPDLPGTHAPNPLLALLLQTRWPSPT